MQLFSPFIFILVFRVFIAESAPSKLLLISLDGFRYDYLDIAKANKINISAFEKIWNTGFRIYRIENEFITRTAPNHFSMVTGQHEESHGIVDNYFYDPKLNATFDFAHESHAFESRWFNMGAEPIWVTNQRHGHKSAVTYWPGHNAEIGGYFPSFHYHAYNQQLPFAKRIEDTVNWLSFDAVTLVLLYYHEPDAEGHASGPDSVQVLLKIGELNHDLDYLLQKIATRPTLSKNLNIILTSDHGMTSVGQNRTIILEDYLDSSMYNSDGPDVRIFWSLWPSSSFTAVDLYNKLVNRHKMMKVFLKKDVPRRLYYSKNRRIAPVVVYSEPEWVIVRNKEALRTYELKGDHGYDPSWHEMSPFFLASGPGFKTFHGNKTIPSMKLVDIYPMMCYLLNLNNPGPHNGSLSRISYLLADQRGWFNGYEDIITVVLVIILAVALSTTICIYACYSRRAKKTIQPNMYLVNRRSYAGLSRPTSILKTFHYEKSKHEVSDGAHNELLQPLPDDDLDENELDGQHKVDDETLLQMLHTPRGCYP